MNRHVRVVFRGVLLLATSGLMLLLVDRLLAVFGSVTPRQDAEYQRRFIRLREHPPNLDLTLVPTDEYLAGTDGLTRKPFRYRTDANGFLLPGAVHAAPDLTVVFVGGSTIECMYVDETNRLPYLSGRLLERLTGWNVNSFNAGVSGNNSLHSLDVILNKVVPMKPNAVLMMHNLNDLSTLLYDGTYWNSNSFRRPIVPLDTRPRLRQLVGGPVRRAFPYVYAALGNVSRKSTDEWSERRGRKLALDGDRVVAAFRMNLAAFIGLCRTYQIEPVLMTQQNRITPDADAFMRKCEESLRRDFGIEWPEYQALYARMNQVIRDVASEHGVLLIDIDQRIPKTRQYMYDRVHLSEEGSALASAYVADSLAAYFQTRGRRPAAAAESAR